MKSLKAAIIGCGPRAYQHAAVAKEERSLEIVYACDTQRSRAEKAASDWNARAAVDHRQALDDRAIEAVIIATGVDTHLPVLADALRAGKHVIVEKPLGNDIAAARALVEQAARSKPVVFVSYQQRFQPRWAALHYAAELIDPVQILYVQGRGMMKPQFLNPAPFCGIMDVVAHPLDLMNWFMRRPPTAVTAVLRRNTFTPATGALDTFSALIDYEDGRSATVSASIGAPEIGSRCDIIGALGNLSLDPAGQLKGVRHAKYESQGKKEPLTFDTAGDNADAALQQAFVQAVREGTPSAAATLKDGLNAMLLILACHRSVEEKRRIELKEMQP